MSGPHPNVYWTVDNNRYYRHTDALIAAEHFNKEIKFFYHKDAFERFNWEIEPPQSFNELCAIRAQQLRDKYKYLRLWYSGGADSHTILRTFLNNMIHLDEIVMVRASPVDNFESMANIEINQRAMPYIESIRHRIPKTKISIADMSSKNYLEYYQSNEWFLQCRIWQFSEDMGLIVSSRENIERYGRLTMPDGCVEINGDLKPKVIRHDNVYYMPIVDSMFSYLHTSHCEEFYTTPELPELHSKQCHQLKHILEQEFPKDQNITHEVYAPVNLSPHFKALWYGCCREQFRPEIDIGKGYDQILSPKGRLSIADAMSNKSSELIKLHSGSLLEFQQSVKTTWTDFNKMPAGNVSGIYNMGEYKHG